MRALIAALILATALAAPATAAIPANYWSQYDASQRLETGRFAVSNGVGNARCLGVGTSRKEYGVKHYRQFECEVTDEDYGNERHLVMTVTGETSFRVKWLGPVRCS